MKNPGLKIAVFLFVLFWPLIPLQAASEDYCIWSPIANTNPKAGEDICNNPGEDYFVRDSTGEFCSDKTKWNKNLICCCQVKERPGQCSMSKVCPAGERCVDGWCTGLTSNTKGPKFTPPNLQIEIPGLNLISEDVKCELGNSGEYSCQVPWLGQYIKAIYNYGLGVVGILAAIVLMAGGVMWLISRGDASKVTQAKEMIIGSITGLIILTGSYVLLIQINPDLVKFKSITIGYIKQAEFIKNGSDSELNTLSSSACPSSNNLQSIKGLVDLNNVSDPRLTSDAVNGLKKAIDEAAKQNVKLLITSANRTYEKQRELWYVELSKHNGDETETRKFVAHPSKCQNTCYGHCAGVAIDVCIKGSPSCGKVGKSSDANYSDADVKKLQSIMKSAGWIRYCAEWWHFQYGQSPANPC